MFVCVRCGGQYSDRVSFCHLCGGFETTVLDASRPADQLWRGGEVQTAAALIKKSVSHITSASYPELKVGRESTIALYGPPGGGKSTLLAKWLDGIPGDVLLLSLEEGLGDSLIERLRRLEIIRDDFHIAYVRSLDEIAEMIDQHRLCAVAVDSLSVSTLGVDDLVRLAGKVGAPVLFSLHTTKDMTPAGAMANLHAVDVVVCVEGLRWRVEKSRFTGAVEGEV